MELNSVVDFQTVLNTPKAKALSWPLLARIGTKPNQTKPKEAPMVNCLKSPDFELLNVDKNNILVSPL